MFDLLMVKDAFLIDDTKKKWAVRGLFLFLLSMIFSFHYFPIGNPDLSLTMNWSLELLNEINAVTNTADLNALDFTLPVFFRGNMIFVFSVMVFRFLLLFFVMLAFLFFLCDKREIPITKGLKLYLVRFPHLFLLLSLFYIAFSIPFLNYFVIIWGLPVFFMAPGAVLFEKKNPIDGLAFSFYATREHRLAVFLNGMLLYLLYSFLRGVISIIFAQSRTGFILIYSLLTAFSILVSGRMLASLYDKMNKTENKHDDADEKKYGG